MAKKNILLGLLAAAILCSAAEVSFGRLLPQSSFRDALGVDWQGWTPYGENIHNGYVGGEIEFAVYDTQSLQLAGESGFAASIESSVNGQGGTMDRYIYVYQIISDSGSFVDGSIDYFKVLYQNGEEINPFLMNNTDSLEDGASGIAPDGVGDTPGIWQWFADTVDVGEQSEFLFYTSANAPVAGSFTMGEPSSDLPVAPEPATMAMLGAGSVMLLRRKRKN